MTDILTERPPVRRGSARARATGVTVLSRYGVLIPFVVVAVVCVLVVPQFLSSSNLANVLVNASLFAVIGYGVTVVIALRGLDLSVGSAQALAACVTAGVLGGAGWGLGLLAGLGTGLAVGLVNGILVAYLRVPAFVATLGTLGILRGIALLVTGGGTIDGTDAALGALATGRVLGIPVPFIIALALLGVWYVVFHYTPFGRHVCAVGGSPDAAIDSGIDVRRVTLLAFVLCGGSAGLAGVLLTGQLGIVTGSLGLGLELQIIAIAVLGGTSLAGGTGNLVGSLVAAVLVAMIAAALNLLDVASYYQYLAVGVLLIVALALDSARRRLSRKKLLEEAS